jgi:hypothetical protein
MNLIPQFSHDNKIQGERLMLQKKFGSHPKKIELFPEGNVLPQGQGNWIPQIGPPEKVNSGSASTTMDLG